MYSFYRYSEVVFQDNGVRERLEKEQEFHSLLATALPYLTVDPEKPQGPQDFFKKRKSTRKSRTISTVVLPFCADKFLRQHTPIFEKYLCHVVRVYLHTFPELLMDIDKQVPFRTVAELRDNASIFDHVVEIEVSHFSRRSLKEKKDYLAKRLKHTRQDEVWSFEGKELWKDIDRKRQAIVHEKTFRRLTKTTFFKR